MSGQFLQRRNSLLKQRIISAIVMAMVMGSAIILLPPELLGWVFAVLVLIGAWEYSAMAGLQRPVPRSLFTLGCALLMWASQYYTGVYTLAADELRLRDIMGLAGLWWAVALLWVVAYPASAALWGSVLMRIGMGLLTLVPAWLALVYLRGQEHGVALILLLIAIVVAADTGAYFAGRAWGDAKLAPAVSPGKSWAGFWGGLTASTALSILVWLQWWRGDWSLGALLSLVAVTSLASVLGDLVESMMKRQRGIKDSGTILPGHGGIMDRLDSITAAAPVFALGIILIGAQ